MEIRTSVFSVGWRDPSPDLIVVYYTAGNQVCMGLSDSGSLILRHWLVV